MITTVGVRNVFATKHIPCRQTTIIGRQWKGNGEMSI